MRNSKVIIITLSIGVVAIFLAILLYLGNKANKNTTEKKHNAINIDNTLDAFSDEVTYGPRTEEIKQFMDNIQYTDTTVNDNQSNQSDQSD